MRKNFSGADYISKISLKSQKLVLCRRNKVIIKEFRILMKVLLNIILVSAFKPSILVQVLYIIS